MPWNLGGKNEKVIIEFVWPIMNKDPFSKYLLKPFALKENVSLYRNEGKRNL